MTRSCFAISIMLALLAREAAGADYVWIVGGGPTPSDSQAQIERNVKWEVEVIHRQAPLAQLKIFFGSGAGDAAKDVVEWRRPVESEAALQPLARVFGASFHNGERYYKNTIPGVEGTTRANDLTARLKADFAQLKADDRALFIFYGHGNRKDTDPAGNALRLWDDTRLTVHDLERLIAGIDHRVPVRFFLPQCFSGGFSKIIYPEMSEPRSAKIRNLCGFMAVAEDRQSEGCSPSVNVGDYRDYTSYFFAALDGRTRQGKPLPSNPDLDGNGVVTLREAHFYSLVNGQSTDVPRATSETYLEDWEPWYLRKVTLQPGPGNVYRGLATHLATRNGLPDSDELMQDAVRHRNEAAARTDALKKEQKESRKESEALEEKIRAAVLARWPEARFPYTSNFRNFLLRDIDAAQQLIVQHADYARLVRVQERRMGLDAGILESNRRQAQFERILRLRRLAQILEKFERFATSNHRAAYARLVSCEEGPL